MYLLTFHDILLLLILSIVITSEMIKWSTSQITTSMTQLIIGTVEIFFHGNKVNVSLSLLFGIYEPFRFIKEVNISIYNDLLFLKLHNL